MKKKKNITDIIKQATELLLISGVINSLVSDWTVIQWSRQKTGAARRYFLMILLAGGIAVKLYMRMKLHEIEGLGEIRDGKE